MLRYLTAGESHGSCLSGILEGMIANLKIDPKEIDLELARRWAGYGRGGRAKIEKDHVEILSGLRKGKTIGSPIALLIKNKDARLEDLGAVTAPRPGHADLAGALKYNQSDVRNILERSSARETSMRVAIGAVCKQLLDEFDIDIISHVVMLGGVSVYTRDLSFETVCRHAERSALRCADKAAEKQMRDRIDRAAKQGDTLGGIFEIRIKGVPPGLGSHVHYDRKLDAALAHALMSVQAIKGVEVGMGFAAAGRPGSQVHDSIHFSKARGFFRKTNNAGGIEGGMSNGEEIVLRAAMKPIATLSKPLDSVDIITKKPVKAAVERHDVCAVPSAGVVGEAVCAFEIAKALLEKFGGDSLEETKRNFK